jgi:hypothetical protein
VTLVRKMSEHEHTPRERGLLVYDLIHEFYADILGILVPGVLVSIAFAGLFVVTAVFILHLWGMPAPVEWLEFFRSGDGGKNNLPGATLVSGALCVTLLILVGYAVGGTFFRLDPRAPDVKSIERVLRTTRETEFRRSELDPGDGTSLDLPMPEGWGLATKSIDLMRGAVDWVRARKRRGVVGWQQAARIAAHPGSQFPYSNMQNYLKQRGFGELAGRVRWGGSTEEKSQRSKMIINAIKIRLYLAADSKCVNISKNEAHIRMMSSIWWAARSLLHACWFSFLAVAGAIAFHVRPIPFPFSVFSEELKKGTFSYWAVISFVFLTSYWLKRHVERCIHYQRVREVFYVLETAYRVGWDGDLTILDIHE